ncbi:hypothetical protein GCM10023176_18030 [Micromonospora coerulea]|uniref:Uncharacterized protein n=1 Tax=Micromonospora coerulea TaxID=47856 RepID=A0ABP8SET2_9ACTN
MSASHATRPDAGAGVAAGTERPESSERPARPAGDPAARRLTSRWPAGTAGPRAPGHEPLASPVVAVAASGHYYSRGRRASRVSAPRSSVAGVARREAPVGALSAPVRQVFTPGCYGTYPGPSAGAGRPATGPAGRTARPPIHRPTERTRARSEERDTS